MNIEDKIFNRFSPELNKLEKYGFKKKNNNFIIEKKFKDNLFKAVIQVNKNGHIKGKVIDLENNEEFLPIRIENNQGAFVGEVKAEYEIILKDIRDNCFSKSYFIYPQSNRITNLIIKKYRNKPEFLWDKFQGTGIFRNPDTQKWYLAVLDVDRGKLQKNKKGKIEVANLKLAPEKIENLLTQKHFYPAYHMNKKYWISIILDDSVSDDKIMELIEESHSYTVHK